MFYAVGYMNNGCQRKYSESVFENGRILKTVQNIENSWIYVWLATLNQIVEIFSSHVFIQLMRMKVAFMLKSLS